MRPDQTSAGQPPAEVRFAVRVRTVCWVLFLLGVIALFVLALSPLRLDAGRSCAGSLLGGTSEVQVNSGDDGDSQTDAADCAALASQQLGFMVLLAVPTVLFGATGILYRPWPHRPPLRAARPHDPDVDG